MSRLGKKPITIPQNTAVTATGSIVKVKGPLGEITKDFKPVISVEIGEGTVTLSPKSSSKEAKALWGTYASELKSMLLGVNKEFSKKLIIEGIGFKADVKGNDIVMTLGFSHPVKVAIPVGIKVVGEKGTLTISGINKENVGRFAAEIRSLKKPEPYKGKGIRYDGETIKMKQGKKAAATG